MKNLLIIVAVFMFGANTLNVRTNTRIMTSNLLDMTSNIIPQMIKVGTNVKSKIHDDLTGHVVICEPINNYAVIMTDIIEYEMMTVECFLSDLEVA